jgi:SAM-dependent methyltransferase
MCHNKRFYDRHLLPRLVHCGCSIGEFSQMRERVIPRAKGVVVEIGLGSGLNLPHYDPPKVDLLIGVEPDATMLEFADERLTKAPFPAELHQATAERLPLKDAMADTVVVTYALCTIADPAKALAEIKRILKPAGKLLFCEHALATGRRARLQCRLDGVWGKLFGGCSITRDPIIAITTAGFIIDDVVARPFPFAQMLLGTHYCGEARAQMAAPMRAEQQTWRARTPLPA